MSEDEKMPYAAKAADLASYVESAIVNGSIPSKFEQKLMSANELHKIVEANSYKPYEGRMKRDRNSSSNSETSIEKPYFTASLSDPRKKENDESLKQLPDVMLKSVYEEKNSQAELNLKIKQMMDSIQDKKFKNDYLEAQDSMI